MQDQTRPVTIRERKPLSEGWFKLEQVTFELTRSDGSTQTLSREVYHNGPGAAVLPLDPGRGTVLLVRQHRIAAYVNGDVPSLIELCAGMVDAGSDVAEAVREEAEQELGYRLRDLQKVFELYMSPGASAEKLHLFTAAYEAAGKVGRGEGLRGEGEDIEVLEMSITRAWELVGLGQIVDAKTVLMLQHAQLTPSGS